jgi:hypothetical protein
MSDNFKWIAAAVVVVGLAVGAVWYRSKMHDKPAPVAQPVTAPPVKPAPPEEPEIEHPVPPVAMPEPLPALGESDAPMQGALVDLLGKEPVEKYLVPQDVIRHIVVTIDNLSTEKVAERIRPLKPTPGSLAVSGTEDAPTLDPANYERYRPLVQLLRNTDTKLLIATYTRYYPLFQEAYENLGHPPRYFNDRVIQVIDHLLATPDLRDPIALTQPGVLYEYADPKIEALSAGQKLLIRMGSDNATFVKHKLRELRTALVVQPKTN